MCLAKFRRRYENLEIRSEDVLQSQDNRAMEEIMAQIEEQISEGRKCFPLKQIHQDLTRRDKEYGYTREHNRTRLKSAILQRFPDLKEESGTRTEIVLVTSHALFQHCRRAVYQGCIWATAHDPMIVEPDAVRHGWKQLTDGSLQPEWITIPEIAHISLITCNCKKGCAAKACLCGKADLNCTYLCKCACNS
jgi:hypothetical protein